MELAAKVAGRLVSSGGSLAAESVEHEVHRALEWLSGERVEVKRHAAVLLLRELAVNAPTFFFQKVQPFLDHIFNAVRDSKVRLSTIYYSPFQNYRRVPRQKPLCQHLYHIKSVITLCIKFSKLGVCYPIL